MKFEVVHTVWGADDEVFGGGVHEVAKPTAAFLRLLAGAEAAGSVVILDAAGHRKKLDGHVQSQAQGEKAYAAAQRSGAWHHGNVQQHIVEMDARLNHWTAERAKFAELPDHPKRAVAVERIEEAQAMKAQSEQILAHLENGAGYDEAVTRTLAGEAPA
jgi:hypothetical protein